MVNAVVEQPLRQTLGLVESLLGMAGLHWPVPDYSTVCRRQKSLDDRAAHPSFNPQSIYRSGHAPDSRCCVNLFGIGDALAYGRFMQQSPDNPLVLDADRSL